jgi:hypothetical protein
MDIHSHLMSCTVAFGLSTAVADKKPWLLKIFGKMCRQQA